MNSQNDQRRRRTPRQRARKRWFGGLGFWTILAVVILMVAYLQIIAASKPHVSGQRLTFAGFVDLAEAGRVRSATILDQDSYIVGAYRRGDGSLARFNVPYLKVLNDRERLLDTLLENRIPAQIDQQFGKSLVQPASLLIPALIVVVVFIYFILSWRRGTGLFGITSGARRVRPDDALVTFDDVAGQDAAIAELRELVDFLSEPERFAKVGARIPRGVLLYGPPGCGKTLLARALAGEAGAAFYSISGSDFVELYVGVGAARVRDLFRDARQNAPAIVFIDELDAVGRRRGPSATVESQGEQEQALNQILAEMDGFSPTEGIIVVGATNRPDVLDQALLRPGRFDRPVGLEWPDEAGRLAILEVHARSRQLAADADLPEIARRAHGLTGADLANVINEAALLAGRRHKLAISQEDLDEALSRILEAPERQRRLSLRDRSIGRRASGREDRVTFDDVAGQREAIAELRELVTFLSEPERFKELGARPPKGVLLYGPPGSGKTLMARAVAGESNAAFFSVGATEFLERYVGSAAARVRDLFADAKAAAPSIVFIDELDAIATKRTGDGSVAVAGTEQEQALNQILAEMDGFSPAQGVIVLAATNRPDMIDPALLRPGRFDRSIGFERPTQEDRLAILTLHAKSRRIDPEVHLDQIAERAHGLTGADLANVINEAALLASRESKPAISQEELDEALKRVLEAPERQRRLAMRDRSVGRRVTGAEERVTFADVAGVDEALDELVEVKDYLAEPERFVEMGARAPRGILLTGPPGCGKTLLAKAVAGEANAAFLSASASEFVEIWVGQGAARVRDLFAEARAVAPAILFIDEIDALGGQRARVSSSGDQEYQQTLNQLLIELDGFEPRSGLILMAATNRPDMLDPALLRPGRFDRQVEITLPDRAGRRAILEVHAKGKRLADDVDLTGVAGVTQGFSGADLANVVNEAALLAARKREPEISRAVMDEAIDRVMLGVTSRRHIPSEEERHHVAYHEAGHALVGLALPGVTVPHRISIVPRGRALGFVLHAYEEERGSQSRSRLINQIAMGLAGRVAEKIVFNEIDSGAAGDLQQVNSIARRMVCRYGMSEALGGVAFRDDYDANGQPDLSLYSEEEKRLIYTEVKRLVDEGEQKASEVLLRSRETLDRIAAMLLERETVSADELKEIVGPALDAGGDGSVSEPVARA